MAFVEAQDGTEIFYRDQGEGRAVVLIHGWPLTADSWDAQANFLIEQGLRVIEYDRRGFGRSGRPGSGYDYDTLAGDLNELLEELAVSDVTLVGFSMGGGEVARYLSTYGPARVSGAVLVSAVTPCLLKTEDNPEGVPGTVFAEIEAKIREDRFDFFRNFAPSFYGRSAVKRTVSEAVLEWFQFMQSSGSLRSILETAKSWATTDFRADLEAIDIPVLVIHGTADQTVPIEVSGHRAAKLLRTATLIEYEGEPHGLTVTAAARLNKDLLEFIGSVR